MTSFLTSIAGTGTAAYPADQHGQPWMFRSDFCWSLITNSGQGGAGGGTYQQDMTNYLTTRQGQGFNTAYCTLVNCVALGGPNDNGQTFDGVVPFTSGVVGNLNNTYWNRVDYLVSTAASLGMTMMLNVAPTEAFNAGCVFNTATTGQCTNYGAALASRYGSASNIMWTFGDDYFSTYDTQYQAILNALRSGGDSHLCTIENFTEADSRYYPFDGSSQAWGLANAQVSLVYSYNTQYTNVEAAYTEASPICVAILDGWWDNGTDFDRNQFWWSVSSGSRGRYYGNAGSISYTQAGFISDLSTDTNGINQGVYWGIFASLPGWHKLVPDTGSALVTAGRGTHKAAIATNGAPYTGSPANTYVSAGLAADGSLALIYNPAANTQTITVNGSLMQAGYTAKWIDPANGATTAATIGATYTQSALNSVGEHDWLLALEGPPPQSQVPLQGPGPAQRAVTVTQAGGMTRCG
jgi:hypothetical protein